MGRNGEIWEGMRKYWKIWKNDGMLDIVRQYARICDNIENQGTLEDREKIGKNGQMRAMVILLGKMWGNIGKHWEQGKYVNILRNTENWKNIGKY